MQLPPLSLLTLARRQEGLVSAGQCDRAGVGAARRGRLVRDEVWERPTRGVFDVEPARDRRHDADHRRRRAAWLGMLAFGPGAVAVGPCALALHRVEGLPRDIAPEIALPGGTAGRNRGGVRVRTFGGFETLRYGDRAIAELVPALVQALPELPRVHAVAVLDGVLRRGSLSDTAYTTVRERARGRRGAAALSSWWALVDRRAESPLETIARLHCVDAGIPPDELQVEIRSARGRLLGRGDLGWRLPQGRWLIAEIDGREFHDRPDALLRDRTRQNALISTGRVDILRFTSNDLRTPTYLPTTIRAALARAATAAEPDMGVVIDARHGTHVGFVAGTSPSGG
ncbi:type IV toxin-antitoxin system AbiEi family antitoxin domain-containing protein [Cellulomonas xylanilytica]|uniref:type IV toxin-antitoxin system AbiEi family antitoxin domain-containing protein n=1 Tax=Cellulomonas xylanilytica TaxID=233583 RepID=UPI001649CEB6|nr:type IV toxin-antitoxin system AbiEi family antitoxin domain-containing protein [Cellulomonas xylanilytica]